MRSHRACTTAPSSGEGKRRTRASLANQGPSQPQDTWARAPYEAPHQDDSSAGDGPQGASDLCTGAWDGHPLGPVPGVVLGQEETGALDNRTLKGLQGLGQQSSGKLVPMSPVPPEMPQ